MKTQYKIYRVPTKAVLGGKFIAIKSFLKGKKKSINQINNLTNHLNKLEKEQIKPNFSGRKEIIKISE